MSTNNLSDPKNVVVGDCVFIKPDILKSYQDRSPHFPQNDNRPSCMVVEDPVHKGIFWAVPVTSSSLDKYQERAKKSPIKYKFYKLGGADRCLNVSQMFPIIRSDVNNIYVRQGKKLTLSRKDFRDLEKTVSKILTTQNMLAQVSNVNAPILLQMAQRRLQIEQNRATRTNTAENTKFFIRGIELEI